MSIQVTVELRGVQERLDKVNRALDTRVFLRLLGLHFLEWINRNFRVGGAERRWAPLSPSTIAGRRGKGAQLLRDTGRLAQSFIPRLSGDVLEVGTEDRRARFLHQGTRPRVIKPQQTFVTKAGRSVGRLSFVTPGGRIVRTFPTLDGRQGVQHPGIPPRPLIPSKMLAEQMAARFLEQHLREAARG